MLGRTASPDEGVVSCLWKQPQAPPLPAGGPLRKTVHLETRYRRPSVWRQTDYFFSLVVHPEMLWPAVDARVEEARGLAGLGIASIDEGGFQDVAGATRQRQIGRFVFAAQRDRDDVL